VISISSNEGNDFSRIFHVAWSEQSGMHYARGLMKSFENGSMLSFDSIPASTAESRSDPRPRSSHVASFSPVYIQGGRAGTQPERGDALRQEIKQHHHRCQAILIQKSDPLQHGEVGQLQIEDLLLAATIAYQRNARQL
jgi:hypothetical protein